MSGLEIDHKTRTEAGHIVLLFMCGKHGGGVPAMNEKWFSMQHLSKSSHGVNLVENNFSIRKMEIAI